MRKVIIYKDKKGEYRFQIKARNGKIIAVGESYKRLNACLKTVKSIVNENVWKVKIDRMTKFEGNVKKKKFSRKDLGF